MQQTLSEKQIREKYVQRHTHDEIDEIHFNRVDKTVRKQIALTEYFGKKCFEITKSRETFPRAVDRLKSQQNRIEIHYDVENHEQYKRIAYQRIDE